MTLNENIERIETAKQSIKTAIEGKGVTVPAETKLEGYPALVDSIQAGSTGSGIDLTGTGWETEPVFPVNVARLGNLQEDLDYTRAALAKWVPSTSASNLFKTETSLVYAPKFDMSGVTSCSGMCQNLKMLTAVPGYNTSNVTTFSEMFDGCASLKTMPNIDLSKGEQMGRMFAYSGIEYVPSFDMHSAITAESMFMGCPNLKRVDKLDFTNLKEGTDFVGGCKELVHLGGFTGLSFSLNLAESTKLTKQSLINVIDELATVTDNRKLYLSKESNDLLGQPELDKLAAKGWSLGNKYNKTETL